MKVDSVASIVMQPTTYCNMNCEYCYLPHRQEPWHMSTAVAESIACSVREIGPSSGIDLVWHGGEPTTLGTRRFRNLLEPFEGLRSEGRIRHSIQSNLLVLSDDWLHLLSEFDFRVGISIDGGPALNRKRKDLRQKETYMRVVNNITRLRANSIPFSIIAVVDRRSLPDAGELVSALNDFGPSHIGINIEETEGSYDAGTATFGDLVNFWSQAIQAGGFLRVSGLREIDRFRAASLPGQSSVWDSVDLFPTVAWNGDVVLLSPEFAGIDSVEYGNFIVGNILHSSLSELLSIGVRSGYVEEFVRGAMACRDSCSIFDACGGGQASNKYFEHGRLDGTMTEYCKGAKLSVVAALAAEIRRS